MYVPKGKTLKEVRTMKYTIKVIENAKTREDWQAIKLNRNTRAGLPLQQGCRERTAELR